MASAEVHNLCTDLMIKQLEKNFIGTGEVK